MVFDTTKRGRLMQKKAVVLVLVVACTLILSLSSAAYHEYFAYSRGTAVTGKVAQGGLGGALPDPNAIAGPEAGGQQPGNINPLPNNPQGLPPVNPAQQGLAQIQQQQNLPPIHPNIPIVIPHGRFLHPQNKVLGFNNRAFACKEAAPITVEVPVPLQQQAQPQQPSSQPSAAIPLGGPTTACGDGTCEATENVTTCPQDCQQAQPQTSPAQPQPIPKEPYRFSNLSGITAPLIDRTSPWEIVVYKYDTTINRNKGGIVWTSAGLTPREGFTNRIFGPEAVRFTDYFDREELLLIAYILLADSPVSISAQAITLTTDKGDIAVYMPSFSGTRSVISPRGSPITINSLMLYVTNDGSTYYATPNHNLESLVSDIDYSNRMMKPEQAITAAHLARQAPAQQQTPTGAAITGLVVADSDNDGIPDDQDKCTRTPANEIPNLIQTVNASPLYGCSPFEPEYPGCNVGVRPVCSARPNCIWVDIITGQPTSNTQGAHCVRQDQLQAPTPPPTTPPTQPPSQPPATPPSGGATTIVQVPQDQISISPECQTLIDDVNNKAFVCQPGGSWTETARMILHARKAVKWQPETGEQPAACCAVNECWNGNACVSVGAETQGTDGNTYICTEEGLQT